MPDTDNQEIAVIHAESAHIEYHIAIRGSLLSWLDEVMDNAMDAPEISSVRYARFGCSSLFNWANAQQFPSDNMLEMRWLNIIPGHEYENLEVQWPF